MSVQRVHGRQPGDAGGVAARCVRELCVELLQPRIGPVPQACVGVVALLFHSTLHRGESGRTDDKRVLVVCAQCRHRRGVQAVDGVRLGVEHARYIPNGRRVCRIEEQQIIGPLFEGAPGGWKTGTAAVIRKPHSVHKQVSAQCGDVQLAGCCYEGDVAFCCVWVKGGDAGCCPPDRLVDVIRGEGRGPALPRGQICAHRVARLRALILGPFEDAGCDLVVYCEGLDEFNGARLGGEGGGQVEDGWHVVDRNRGSGGAVESLERVHRGIPDTDDVVDGGCVVIIDIEHATGPHFELSPVGWIAWRC